MFKTYKDALPEREDHMSKPTFNDIVKLITMHGESKYGFSTYYIKFQCGKTVFDEMLDRIR